MSDIKVVAFDCDGVMFDTRASNRAYYNSILEHFGKPLMTDKQFTYVHSHTVDSSMAYLFDDEKSYRAAQDYRRGVHYLPFFKYMEMEPYLKPLLEKLQPRFKTAVATNRSDTMIPLLQAYGLEDSCDIVDRSIDVSRPKPYPDVLTKVIDHFRVNPAEVIYVGDSELDEKAAAAAGIPFVAYENPSLTAKFHITSLKALEGILNGFNVECLPE